MNRPTGPIQSSSRHVRLFVCLSVCLRHRKTPTSVGRGDLWLKNVFLILVCDDPILIHKKMHAFFPEIVKMRGFEPAYCG